MLGRDPREYAVPGPPPPPPPPFSLPPPLPPPFSPPSLSPPPPRPPPLFFFSFPPLPSSPLPHPPPSPSCLSPPSPTLPPSPSCPDDGTGRSGESRWRAGGPGAGAVPRGVAARRRGGAPATWSFSWGPPFRLTGGHATPAPPRGWGWRPSGGWCPPATGSFAPAPRGGVLWLGTCGGGPPSSYGPSPRGVGRPGDRPGGSSGGGAAGRPSPEPARATAVRSRVGGGHGGGHGTEVATPGGRPGRGSDVCTLPLLAAPALRLFWPSAPVAPGPPPGGAWGQPSADRRGPSPGPRLARVLNIFLSAGPRGGGGTLVLHTGGAPGGLPSVDLLLNPQGAGPRRPGLLRSSGSPAWLQRRLRLGRSSALPLHRSLPPQWVQFETPIDWLALPAVAALVPTGHLPGPFGPRPFDGPSSSDPGGGIPPLPNTPRRSLPLPVPGSPASTGLCAAAC